MTNLLLSINVEVAEDSLAIFPTKLLQYEGAKRHVSIAHIDDVRRLPNRGLLPARIFQKNHGRALEIIPDQPHWRAFDTGMDFDPRHDPIASDEDIQTLHAVHKWQMLAEERPPIHISF